MSSVFDALSKPAASVQIPDDHGIVSYPIEHEDGNRIMHYWTVKMPEPGELDKLYGALASINGVVIKDDTIKFEFGIEKMRGFPPRIIELTLLVIDYKEVADEFAEMAYVRHMASQQGTSSN